MGPHLQHDSVWCTVVCSHAGLTWAHGPAGCIGRSYWLAPSMPSMKCPRRPVKSIANSPGCFPCVMACADCGSSIVSAMQSTCSRCASANDSSPHNNAEVRCVTCRCCQSMGGTQGCKRYQAFSRLMLHLPSVVRARQASQVKRPLSSVQNEGEQLLVLKWCRCSVSSAHQSRHLDLV